MAGSDRRYIALLRGVNVGGHSIVKMADLRRLFESFGLTDVETYIQSGNVLFSTDDADPDRIAQALEERLRLAAGRAMRVFVRTRADLEEAARNNPFEPEHRDEMQRCHLMFLSAEPDAPHREALMALRGEEYQLYVHDKVLYYAYSRQYDGNRRTIDFEKVLGVTGTARSWKVVNKLIELAS